MLLWQYDKWVYVCIAKVINQKVNLELLSSGQGKWNQKPIINHPSHWGPDIGQAAQSRICVERDRDIISITRKPPKWGADELRVPVKHQTRAPESKMANGKAASCPEIRARILKRKVDR